MAAKSFTWDEAGGDGISEVTAALERQREGLGQPLAARTCVHVDLFGRDVAGVVSGVDDVPGVPVSRRVEMWQRRQAARQLPATTLATVDNDRKPQPAPRPKRRQFRTLVSHRRRRDPPDLEHHAHRRVGALTPPALPLSLSRGPGYPHLRLNPSSNTKAHHRRRLRVRPPIRRHCIPRPPAFLSASRASGCRTRLSK